MIETESEEDITKLREKVENKPRLKEAFECRVPKKMLSTIIILDVEEEFNNSKLQEKLFEANEEIEEEDVTVARKWKNKKNN